MSEEKITGLIRIVIGLMFFFGGLWKIMNSAAFTSNFAIFGLSLPWLAWILLLSEIIFGLALVVGWKVEKTAWPLLVVMAGALVVNWIPNISFGIPSITAIGFHLLTLLVLFKLITTGPGEWAVSK